MALLKKLKSLLGLGDGQSGSDRQDTDTVGVTVEREPDAETSATESDDAPPATPAPGSGAADPDPAETAEPTPESDAASDSAVEPEVDSPPAEDTTDEPAEELDGRGSTAEPEPESNSGPAVDADAAETDPAADSEPETESAESGTDTESAAASDLEAGDEEPVRDIKGIGPSYATKLSEVGVDSAADLAAADADDLSERTGLSAKRIQGWIDRASDH